MLRSTNAKMGNRIGIRNDHLADFVDQDDDPLARATEHLTGQSEVPLQQSFDDDPLTQLRAHRYQDDPLSPMKVNWHKLSFEVAEQLYTDWVVFCKAMGREDCINIGNTVEDAFMAAACAGGVLPEAGAEINQEMSETHHWLLRWRKFGYPTFVLTHSLAAALMLTDCSAVSGSDFRFPFPSFLICMPYPHSPLSIDGEHGESDVRWIMVHSMDYPHHDDAHKMEERLAAKGWLRTNREEVRWIHSTMIRFIEPYGIGVFERKPMPDDGDTLEEWLMTGKVLGAVHHLETTSLDEAATISGLRLVANLCLYLDAQQQDGHDLPEQQISNPKKKKKKRVVEPKAPTPWVLGKGLKLDRNLRGAAAQSAKPKSQQRAEWSLQSQHVVRGHWKTQPHGPGRSMRKRIHVDPYWRGPDLSDAVLRSFTEKS